MCVCGGKGMKGVGRREAAETGKRLTRQAETRNLQSGAEQGLGTGAGKAGTGTRSGWSRDCEWDAGEATEKGQTRRAWQVRCEPPMLFRPQSGRLL